MLLFHWPCGTEGQLTGTSVSSSRTAGTKLAVTDLKHRSKLIIWYTQERETEGERTRPCTQQTRVSRGIKLPKDQSSSTAAQQPIHIHRKDALKWAVDWLLLGSISWTRVKRRLQRWHASYLPKFAEINPEGEHGQLLLHTVNQLLKDTYRTACDLRDPRKQMGFAFSCTMRFS